MRTRPDLITQVQNLSAASLPYKTKVNISEPTDKDTIINLVMEQCKLLFLCMQNFTKKICETLIKKAISSIDSVSKEFKVLVRKTQEYLDNFQQIFNKNMIALAKDLLVKN
ncbi:6785_t:CDS:2, partial [Dentiscutata heterogama]